MKDIEEGEEREVGGGGALEKENREKEKHKCWGKEKEERRGGGKWFCFKLLCDRCVGGELYIQCVEHG